MKLIIYDTVNSQPQPCGKRSLNISLKGAFFLSTQAVKMCRLKDGDRIVIARSSDNPKEWFLGKTENESGFTLRRIKNFLKMNNKYVATTILSSLKLNSNATFLISKNTENIDGVEYYRLLTGSPIINKAIKGPRKKQ